MGNNNNNGVYPDPEQADALNAKCDKYADSQWKPYKHKTVYNPFTDKAVPRGGAGRVGVVDCETMVGDISEHDVHKMLIAKVWLSVDAPGRTQSLRRGAEEWKLVKNVTTALRHGFPGLQHAQLFTKLKAIDGSVTMRDMMCILAHNVHSMTESLRKSFGMCDEFYNALPLVRALPPKPTRDHRPATAGVIPCKAEVAVFRVFLWEALNGSTDVRLENALWARKLENQCTIL